MKSILFPVLALLSFSFVQSCGSEAKTDDETAKKEKKKDSIAVDTPEIKETQPERVRLSKHAASWIDSNLDNDVFCSDRVDQWVHASKSEFEEPQEAVDDYEFDFLTEKQMKKLTTRELIYYVLAYPSSFSQVCAEGLYDTTNTPKISGFIPFSYESEEMSELQVNEIGFRRDSVIAVLTEYIEEHPDRIDTEYLRMLKMLDAYEAFPVIIKTASEKNLGNYAFLLDFMHANEVAGLREMDFYDRMYGEESWRYDNCVEATPKVRKAVIKLATAFYKEMNGD